MKIINLVTFSQVTDKSEPRDGTMCMFIHQCDENGNPTRFEVKPYYANEADTGA
jgi:hypothetical protein